MQECHFGSIEAYWTNHKPIFFAFKLPSYVAKSSLLDNKT